MTAVDQARATDALATEFENLLALGRSLAADDWHRPTSLPGWDVQAVFAHLTGTEAMLLGEPTPEVGVDVGALPHVRNDMGAFNEAWVVALAGATGEEMVDALRARLETRLTAVRAMSAEEWDAVASTPAGPDTAGRFIRIRIMDCWMHEQDVRDAVGRPGHEAGAVVELALDEIAGSLGYVVGKKAGAPDGSSVTFRLTGSAGRDVHVAVDGRATLVPSLPGEPTVALTMPVGTFVRLAGGRSTDTSPVAVDGDASLGERILENLAFMI